MKLFGILGAIRPVVHDDYPDCYIPEIWAQEALMVLEANTVMLPLVHRDFSTLIAKQGDIINTRRPGQMTPQRKVDGDTITFQRPTADNVAIPLDQHIHTSFIVYDGEETKGMQSLIDTYLTPAVESISQQIDQLLLMQQYSFLDNGVGDFVNAPDEDDVIAVREKMNTNKCPVQGRSMIVTPATEGDLLSVTQFVEADQLGDDGSALREGALGKKYGINFYMSQNCPQIASGNTVTLGAVNYSSGYAAGSTSIVMDGFSPVPVVGEWLTIAGDDTPQLVTAFGGGTTATLYPGLRSAVANNAVVTCYVGGAVNFGAGYAAGWTKPIVINGFTVAPKSGQLITIGADAGTDPVYGAIDTPTTTSMYANRGLDAAVATADVVGIGPKGSYNFCFHRNAIAFISRPLVKPRGNVTSAVVNYKGIGIRVTIGYDMDVQGHKITVDLLCGTKVLDVNLGAILFAPEA